jgi:hypothetical protein
MAKAIIHNSDYQYIEEFGLILQKNFDSFSGEHEVLPYTCAFTGGKKSGSGFRFTQPVDFFSIYGKIRP